MGLGRTLLEFIYPGGDPAGGGDGGQGPEVASPLSILAPLELWVRSASHPLASYLRAWLRMPGVEHHLKGAGAARPLRGLFPCACPIFPLATGGRRGRRWAALQMGRRWVRLQMGVASYFGEGRPDRPSRRLAIPDTPAHLAAIKQSVRDAVHFVRLGARVPPSSGRSGPGVVGLMAAVALASEGLRAVGPQ